MAIILADHQKEKLIKAVQQYPCLYNCKLDAYHNKSSRDSAWTAVANQCNLSGKEDLCKGAWKKLKEKYRRKKLQARAARAGDGSMLTSQWEFFHTMSFVEPYIRPRKISSNWQLQFNQTSSHPQGETQDVPEANSLNQFMFDVSGASTSVVSSAVDQPSSSTEPSVASRTSEIESDDNDFESNSSVVHTSVNEPQLQTTKSRKRSKRARLAANEDIRIQSVMSELKDNNSKTINLCDDHILLFFVSMAEEVRKLPWSTRLRVQSQISTLIADAIDQM